MNRSPVAFLGRLLVLMAPVVLLGSMAYGNAAPPRKPTPPPEGPFVQVEVVADLERATLIVPKKLLPAEKKADAGLSPTRTAVAGVAISGAVALLGLQLFRRRGGKPGVLLIVGGVSMALVSAAAIADIPPPNGGKPSGLRPPAWRDQVPSGVPVTIQVVDEGEQVILRISPQGLRVAAPERPGDAAPGAPAPGGAAPDAPAPGNAAPAPEKK